jgi:hypothetical protein
VVCDVAVVVCGTDSVSVRVSVHDSLRRGSDSDRVLQGRIVETVTGRVSNVCVAESASFVQWPSVAVLLQGAEVCACVAASVSFASILAENRAMIPCWL